MKKVEIIKLVKITAGGGHGWFETNIGLLVRKPLIKLRELREKK